MHESPLLKNKIIQGRLLSHPPQLTTPSTSPSQSSPSLAVTQCVSLSSLSSAQLSSLSSPLPWPSPLPRPYPTFSSWRLGTLLWNLWLESAYTFLQPSPVGSLHQSPHLRPGQPILHRGARGSGGRRQHWSLVERELWLVLHLLATRCRSSDRHVGRFILVISARIKIVHIQFPWHLTSLNPLSVRPLVWQNHL